MNQQVCALVPIEVTQTKSPDWGKLQVVRTTFYTNTIKSAVPSIQSTDPRVAALNVIIHGVTRFLGFLHEPSGPIGRGAY